MCQPASFIVTRENVLFSLWTDSHAEMLEEFRINDNSQYRTPEIVKVEITPPSINYTNGYRIYNFSAPFEEWIPEVEIPYMFPYENETRELHCSDWMQEGNIITRTMEYLPRWLEKRVVKRETNIENINRRDGFLYVDESAEIYHVFGIAELYQGVKVHYVCVGAEIRFAHFGCEISRVSEGAYINSIHGGKIGSMEGYIRMAVDCEIEELTGQIDIALRCRINKIKYPGTIINDTTGSVIRKNWMDDYKRVTT